MSPNPLAKTFITEFDKMNYVFETSGYYLDSIIWYESETLSCSTGLEKIRALDLDDGVLTVIYKKELNQDHISFSFSSKPYPAGVITFGFPDNSRNCHRLKETKPLVNQLRSFIKLTQSDYFYRRNNP